MLTHITSLTRRICVLAIRLMVAPLHKNIYIYEYWVITGKIEEENLREIVFNLIRNSVCALV